MITVLLSLLSQPVPVAGFDFSMYRPAIDSELDGKSPYADVFGAGRQPLLGGHLGLLLPLGDDLALTAALSVLRFGNSAKAFVDDGDSTTPSSGSSRSGGETSISVLPFSLLAGARLTSLWTRLRLPLLLYVEGGPTLAWWSVSRGDGSTAAEGATAGLSLGTGVMLELTGVDRRTRQTLYEEFSVSRVALRAGVSRLWLDGFNAAGALVLSDTAWTLGLELGF